MSNNGSTVDMREGRFALNVRFLVEQLHRVLKPGCNACIHIQQLLAFKNQHGFMGRRDFRGALVDLFGAGGFHWIGEFAIVKDPQIIAMRLNLHSLQFKTGYARSGTFLAPAPNDYVMIFTKPGETPNPVRCIRHKKKNPHGWVSQEEWIRDAHGIWVDIRMTDVLDVAHTREQAQEKHVCPLQLSVISRLVRLYTNPITSQPDVTVLDPFMGIGSTAWVCMQGQTQDGPIEEARNVVGFELKGSYYRAALSNVRKALANQSQSLLEFTDDPGEEGPPTAGAAPPLGNGDALDDEDDDADEDRVDYGGEFLHALSQEYAKEDAARGIVEGDDDDDDDEDEWDL